MGFANGIQMGFALWKACLSRRRKKDGRTALKAQQSRPLLLRKVVCLVKRGLFRAQGRDSLHPCIRTYFNRQPTTLPKLPSTQVTLSSPNDWIQILCWAVSAMLSFYNWGKLLTCRLLTLQVVFRTLPALVKYLLLIIWKIYYLFPAESRKHTRHFPDIKDGKVPSPKGNSWLTKEGQTAGASKLSSAGRETGSSMTCYLGLLRSFPWA